MEQIIQNGAVTRGWIGVEAQEITPELAESFGLPDNEGALIAGVVRGSPADSRRHPSRRRAADRRRQAGQGPAGHARPDRRAQARTNARPSACAVTRTSSKLQVKIGKRPAMRAEQE